MNTYNFSTVVKLKNCKSNADHLYVVNFRATSRKVKSIDMPRKDRKLKHKILKIMEGRKSIEDQSRNKEQRILEQIS